MCTPSSTSSPQGEIALSVRAPIIFTSFEENPDRYDYPRGPHLENDGNNYLDWKHHTKGLLRLRNLWGIVNADIPIPDPSAPPNERAEWSRKDREAHLLIVFTIKKEPFKATMDAETAKECWDELLVWYQRIWEPQLFGLFNQVIRTSFSDTEPLGPQIDALVRAALIMESLGDGLDDKVLALAILSSLPSSLSHIITILFCNTKLPDISSAYVKRFILDNEKLRKCISMSAKSAKKGKRAKQNKPAKKH